MSDIFQPMLSPISGSPHIAPGISDQSKNILLKSLAPMAMDAYTGYNTAQLEGAIDYETQQYFDKKEQYALGEEAGVAAQGLRMGIDSVWDNFDGTIEEANTLEVGFRKKMETYTNALKQGRMTPDQLYSRIIATTKEHVARNPFLQKQLLAHADSYLEMSGLGGYLKQAMKTQEDQADFQKKVIESAALKAKDFGIDALNDPLWYEKTLERQKELATMDQIAKQLAHVKNMMPEEASKFMQGMNKVLYPAIWTNHLNTMAEIVNRPDLQGKWDAQKQMIVMQSRQFVDGLKKLVIENNPRLLDEQPVKDFLKSAEDSVATITKAIEENQSGETLKTFFTNQRDAAKAKQEILVMGEVNLSALEAATKIWAVLPDNLKFRFFGNNGELVTQHLNTLQKLLSGKAPISNPASIIGSTQAIVSQGNPEQIAATIGGLNKWLTENTPGLKDKVDVLAHTIRDIGSQTNIPLLNQFSPEARRQATVLAEEYKDSIQTYSGKALEKLAEEGINLVWNMLPSGDMVLSYGPNSVRDDKKLAEINKTYADHMTNYIKSMSHLMGNTNYEDTFKKLYDQSIPPAKTRLDQYQQIAKAYNEALRGGNLDLAKRLEASLALMEKQDGGYTPGADWEYPKTTAPSGGAYPQEGMASAPVTKPSISPAFAQELRNPTVVPQVDVAKQSRDILMQEVEGALKKTGPKTSPLLKKDKKTDAIESISYVQALHEVPGAGPAIEGFMLAFGLTAAIPTLAKKLPHLFKEGSVAATASNVVMPGGVSVGASKAMAQGMINEAKKADMAKAKALYKQYWEKEWPKERIDLPKSDLEWSNAINQANQWVKLRMEKPTLKSMEKK